jgi:hypothetical protein
VYSSHCIEHTCDAVRHLQQVSKLLTKGGKYHLVIPDKRYCFDYFKETSTIGGLIDAYENGNSDYSLKLWIDRAWIGTHADARRHWNGDHGSQNKTGLAKKIKAAIKEYKSGYRLPGGTHVWCFTPASFSETMSLLRELGYIDLQLLELYPTRPNTLEFYTVLGH